MENKSLFDLTTEERWKYILKSTLIVLVITLGLYFFVTWYWLQYLLGILSFALLQLFGFETTWLTNYNIGGSLTSSDLNMRTLKSVLGGYFASVVPGSTSEGLGLATLVELYDAIERNVPFLNWNYGTAPAVRAHYEEGAAVNGGTSLFTVVKACTAMQAGGLMIGLIVVSPGTKTNKTKAATLMLLVLFFGNAIRIFALIGITMILANNYGLEYEQAWFWSHDVAGRVFSFLGTLLFLVIIEKSGVKILDTIVVTMETILTQLRLIPPPPKK